MIVKPQDEFQVLFEGTPDLLYSQDLAGRVLRINRAFERITGYSRSEVVGKSIYDLIAPEHQDMLRSRIFEHVGGGSSQAIEVDMMAKAGRVPVELTVELLFHEGRPVGVHGFGRDITDKLRARLDRSAADSALLRQTEQLATFSRYLQLLHRLSTTHYSRIDDVFSDYLNTGCQIFSVDCGSILQCAENGFLTRRACGPVPPVIEEGARRVLASEDTLAGAMRDSTGRASFYVGTRLNVAGEKFGVLSFWSPDSSQMHPQASEIIEMMARGIESAMQQRRLTEELEYRARHDSLTGLANRVTLSEQLQRSIIEARANNSRVGVIFMDLDRFKEINDRLGHEAGDVALQDVANRLASCQSDRCFVARVGGDEFAAVVHGVHSAAEVEFVARQFRDALNQPLLLHGLRIQITLSSGVSLFPDDGDDTGVLLRRADLAMYEAKQAGGNLVRLAAG